MGISKNEAELAVKIVKANTDPGHLHLISAVCGSLSGVKIGDSIGKRVETMTPRAILEATNGKGITGFGKALQDDGFNFFYGLEPGDHTDDYQLTASVAASLAINNGFDIENMGFMLAADYIRKISGWGKTTRIAAQDILKFFQTSGREGRHPSQRAPKAPDGQGGGNGVAMKVAPLALFYGLRFIAGMYGFDSHARQQLLASTKSLGEMTHPDRRASIAGYAVGKVIFDLLVQGYKEEWSEQDRYGLLDNLIEDVKLAEHGYLQPGFPDLFSSRLSRIRDSRLLSDLNKLISEVGTNCFALESVPFAIAVFLRHPNDLVKGVLEAVNAGGDADTTAAIAGSMIGANVGITRIPNEFRFYRSDFWEPINLGIELYNTVFSK